MRIHKKNFDSPKKTNKFVRGLSISLCAFIGLTISTDYISHNNYKYEIVNKIDNDTDYLLKELELSTGIKSNNKNIVVLHAILNNRKIDDNEKEYFYELKDLISENPYIDIKKSYEMFSNLDIIYTNNSNKYDESVLATFSYENDIIKVFEAKDNFNIEIFLHEIVHALFTNEKTIKLPKFILEGETELLTNEYLSNNPFVEKNTYPFEIALVKLLCEMVEPDEVLKTYTTGDINSLYEKLDKSSNLDSKRFIDNVDKVFTAFTNKEQIPAEIYNEMIIYLDNYFSTNYYDNTEKLELYEYYKGILNTIYLDNPYLEYEKYIQENGVIIKPYYSSKLKEQYQVVEQVKIDKTTEKTLRKAL